MINQLRELNKELVEAKIFSRKLRLSNSVKEIPTAVLISDINDIRNEGCSQNLSSVADDFVGSHLSNLEQRVALETMWLEGYSYRNDLQWLDR